MLRSSEKKLRLDKNSSGVQLMDVIVDPDSANRALKSIKKPESLKLSPEQALALLVEANLTKSAYNLIRANALKANHDLYPSYEQVF